jgi:hypothetical protein
MSHKTAVRKQLYETCAIFYATFFIKVCHHLGFSVASAAGVSLATTLPVNTRTVITMSYLAMRSLLRSYALVDGRANLKKKKYIY